MTKDPNLKLKRFGTHWSWGRQGGSRARPILRPSERPTTGATVAASTSWSNLNLSNPELDLQQISKLFEKQFGTQLKGSTASCSLPKHLQRMSYVRQFQPEFVLLYHFAQDVGFPPTPSCGMHQCYGYKVGTPCFWSRRVVCSRRANFSWKV